MALDAPGSISGECRNSIKYSKPTALYRLGLIEWDDFVCTHVRMARTAAHAGLQFVMGCRCG